MAIPHASSFRLRRSHLYVAANDGGNRNAWIGLDLHGTRSNRDANGAEVKLTSQSGKVQYGMVTTTASYQSAQDKRLFFGIGSEGHSEEHRDHLAVRKEAGDRKSASPENSLDHRAVDFRLLYASSAITVRSCSVNLPRSLRVRFAVAIGSRILSVTKPGFTTPAPYGNTARVPMIATGTTGTPARIAMYAPPSLKGRITPS